jgi:hypothetical protein
MTHPEPSEMPDHDYWGASIRLKPERSRTRLNYTAIFCIVTIAVWIVAAIAGK